PKPIHTDIRIPVSGISNYPDALKILDGGYETDKASFARNAGADARYLKRAKQLQINNAPVIASIPTLETGMANYSYTIVAIDDDKDYLYYREAILPSWIKLDTLNHTISGTPPENSSGKTFPVKVLVGDGTTEVSQSFHIKVDSALGLHPGNDDNEMKKKHLYPNPAKDFTTINLGPRVNMVQSIHIADIAGKIIKNVSGYTAYNDNVYISLKNTPEQLVLIQILFNDGLQNSYKLMVQR
ncbi:MAG: putative Ig domain-containing protein, partial [Bacteroidales bacterium]